MTENLARQIGAGQVCALLIAGAGIGWLVGLSLSPVVGTVLAVIMSAVGGVVAGMASVGNDSARQRVNAWPTAILLVGVALGGPAGIVARSHNIFGQTAVEGHVTNELTATLKSDDARARAALSALYSLTGDDCKRLLGSPDQSLAGALETSRFPWAQRLARRQLDAKVLREIVECLCEE